MKKLCIAILALLMPILVFGSILGMKPLSIFKMDHSLLRSGTYVPETIMQKEMIDGEWEEDTRYDFHYLPYHGGRSQIDYVVEYKKFDGEWLDSIRGDFEYNASGLCSEFQVMNTQGEIICLTINGTAEYDDYDRLTTFEVDIYYWLDYFYKGLQRMEIEYLSNTGMEISVYIQDEQGVRYKNVEIELDSQNRMRKATVYSSDNAIDWLAESEFTFGYHAQDTSCIEDFIRYLSDNIVMLMLMEGEMMYGMVTDVDEYHWDYDPLSYRKYFYDYDLDLMKTAKNWYCLGAIDDNTPGWVCFYRNNYAYDVNGNVIEVLSERCQKGEYYEDWLTEISYQMLTDNHDEASPAVSPIKLSVYPQPFATSVNIRGESKTGGEIKVEIFNLKGQKLKSLVLPSGMNFTWDGRDASGKNLPSSVYLMRASQDGKSSSKKVIKMK